MTDVTLDTLTHRLNRLERENRLLRMIGTVALVVVISVALIGQSLPKDRTLEGEKFHLKDSRR